MVLLTQQNRSRTATESVKMGIFEEVKAEILSVLFGSLKNLISPSEMCSSAILLSFLKTEKLHCLE